MKCEQDMSISAGLAAFFLCHEKFAIFTTEKTIVKFYIFNGVYLEGNETRFTLIYLKIILLTNQIMIKVDHVVYPCETCKTSEDPNQTSRPSKRKALIFNQVL